MDLATPPALDIIEDFMILNDAYTRPGVSELNPIGLNDLGGSGSWGVVIMLGVSQV